ncbi:MAG: acid phosphatase AphA [Endozoicomonas sp. (ex Botrylloides leachii)]|nr:acid phosphatase AphA [Endozoicomonas sp. (ex Botrylloides leachii)]
MKKALFASATLALTLASPFCSADIQPAPVKSTGVTSAQLMKRAAVDWVTVDEIKQSLKGKPPMAVGLDIDDTTLFSSPGYFRGKMEYSPNSDAYLKNPAFWKKMNGGWDNFSIPKTIAKKLIKMHEARGDTIYFITARPYTKGEKVTAIIKRDFHIKNMKPVIFADKSKANPLDKTDNLKKYHIKLYYGDANADMTSARAAGARGIRVMRAANSAFYPLPNNGKYGEEVIANSQV